MKRPWGWLLLWLPALLLAGCNDDGIAELAQREGVGTPPVLKNLAVAFAPHNPVDDSAGDFQFMLTEQKVFLEYGVTVIGPEGPKVLPTFEYRVRDTAVVVAPADGIVDRVDFNTDSGDFFVWIRPAPGSGWIVEVDHLTAVTVSAGQAVTAGTPLGNPGLWGVPGLGRTEIMILQPGQPPQTVCPFSVFDPALETAYRDQVTQHMADWEVFKADPALYDEAAMLVPGCLYDTLPG